MRQRKVKAGLTTEQRLFINRLDAAITRAGGFKAAVLAIWGEGTTGGTLSKILSGEAPNPGIWTVKKIADPLGVTLSELVGDNIQPLSAEDRASLREILATLVSVTDVTSSLVGKLETPLGSRRAAIPDPRSGSNGAQSANLTDVDVRLMGGGEEAAGEGKSIAEQRDNGRRNRDAQNSAGSGTTTDDSLDSGSSHKK